jgi:hypothetical protein
VTPPRRDGCDRGDDDTPIAGFQARHAERGTDRGGDPRIAQRRRHGDTLLAAADGGVEVEIATSRCRPTLGLEALIESDELVTFLCGGDSQLVVTRSSIQSNEQRQGANWRVADVAAEVAELRARGLEPAEYDEAGFKTIDGVTDVASPSRLLLWRLPGSGHPTRGAKR